jgi:hypothetical protein
VHFHTPTSDWGGSLAVRASIAARDDGPFRENSCLTRSPLIAVLITLVPLPRGDAVDRTELSDPDLSGHDQSIPR